MENNNNLLIEIFPELALKIKQVFLKHNRIDLYEQVDKLSIVALCDCGENNCGSFYTIPPPNEEEDFKAEGFVVSNGLIAVEVYEGKVGYIEILPSQYGYEIRKILATLFN